MNPTISDLVQSGIKAMIQTIIPAIPVDAELAQEQSHLLIGLLKLIEENWRYAVALEAKAAAHWRDTATMLAAEAEGGEQTTAAAARLRAEVAGLGWLQERPAVSYDQLEKSRRAICEDVDALVRAGAVDGSASFRAACLAIIVGRTAAEANHGLSWTNPTRLSPSWQSVASLRTMIEPGDQTPG